MRLFALCLVILPYTSAAPLTTTQDPWTLPCPFNKDCLCTQKPGTPEKLTYRQVDCTPKNGKMPEFEPLPDAKYNVTGRFSIEADVRKIPANHFVAFENIVELLTLTQKSGLPGSAEVDWDDKAFDGVNVGALELDRLDGVIPAPAALRNVAGLKSLWIFTCPSPVTLKDHSFEKMHLETLQIHSTKITGIDERAFEDLEDTLETLVFYDSKFADLDFLGKAMSRLKRLDLLNLEKNSITQIKHNSLPNVPLRVLYLHNNPISLIEDGAFSGLKGLEVLWLTGTKVKAVDLKLFSDIDTNFLNIDMSSISTLKQMTTSETEKFPVNTTIGVVKNGLEIIDSKVGELLLNVPDLRIHMESNTRLTCAGLSWMNQFQCPGNLTIDGCRCLDQKNKPLDQYLKSLDPNTKCGFTKWGN